MEQKKESTKQAINRIRKTLKEMDSRPSSKESKLVYGELQAELSHLLETLAVNSKRGKKSRNKGAVYERKVAGIFKDALDVNLSRTPQSGGFQKGKNTNSDFKGDVVCLDEGVDFKLHIECKNAETLSIPKWTKQAEEDCPPGKVPAIVFHRKNTDVESIVLTLEDFLKIVDKNKIVIVEEKGNAEDRLANVQPVQGRPRKRRILPRKKTRPLQGE